MGIERRSTTAYENFTIERIVLLQGNEGYDISEIFKSISITEGITGGLLNGTLDFVESMNIIDSMNPRGDEKLQVSFRSVHMNGEDAKTYSKLFKIVHYEDVTNSNTMTKKYVRIHFVSDPEMKNEYSRISKSYKNTSIHFIVSEMLRIIGFPETMMSVEKTLYNRDIVIPNMTPLSVIAHLAQHAQSSEPNAKGDSNFYFYEDIDGVKFVSGSTLLSKDPVVDLMYAASHDISMYNHVVKFQRVRGYNIPEQYRNGGIGSDVYSHSIQNKLYTYSYNDYDNVKSVFPKVNPEKWYGGEIEPKRNTSVQLVPEDQMYKYINIGSNGNSNAIRSVNRTSMQSKRALIQIPGNSDISCGHIVNIIAGDMNGEMASKDAGRWLVNSLTHILTRETYFMNAEIISDSDMRGR